MRYLIHTDFVEGAKVMALNYRKKPAQWEPGTVLDVKARLKPDEEYSLSIRVRLDRTTRPTRGNSLGILILTVGEKSLMLQR